MRKLLFPLLAVLALPNAVNADYYLVLQYYKQANVGSGENPRVADYTSPGITVIPMETLAQCTSAGNDLIKTLYKPVNSFEGQYRCIEGR